VNNADLLAVIRQNLAEPQRREQPVVYDLGKA
jgi:hypothetical protein